VFLIAPTLKYFDVLSPPYIHSLDSACVQTYVRITWN
jgi:hypothetical protein